MQKIFLLSSKTLQSRINRCYDILFSNLKQKKKRNIIISSVISSHIGPCTIYSGIMLYPHSGDVLFRSNIIHLSKISYTYNKRADDITILA